MAAGRTRPFFLFGKGWSIGNSGKRQGSTHRCLHKADGSRTTTGRHFQHCVVYARGCRGSAEIKEKSDQQAACPVVERQCVPCLFRSCPQVLRDLRRLLVGRSHKSTESPFSGLRVGPHPPRLRESRATQTVKELCHNSFVNRGLADGHEEKGVSSAAATVVCAFKTTYDSTDLRLSWFPVEAVFLLSSRRRWAARVQLRPGVHAGSPANPGPKEQKKHQHQKQNARLPCLQKNGPPGSGTCPGFLGMVISPLFRVGRRPGQRARVRARTTISQWQRFVHAMLVIMRSFDHDEEERYRAM